MMKIMAMLVFLITCQGVYAQKKKNTKVVVKKKAEAVQPSPADLLYSNMLENTQRVFFIDSIVVDKDNFIRHIPLPQECGILKRINSESSPGFSFTNEFGNKMYYSMEDTLGNSTLFTKDMLGGKWSKPTELTGIDNSESPNYPFMMADGITFYFAQKGESSLGGYDIFVTRYNSETGEFLRPNNIGLPFNSKANDYMYVIDELDSLGWLVTDRNQPDGKVCIYTFVPSKTRENLNLEEMTEDEVKPFAEIQSIKATWPNKQAREVAMKRLLGMKKRLRTHTDTSSFTFDVNDQLTYHSPNDFRSTVARDLFMELLQAKERSEADASQLEALRERYHQADEQGRKELQQTILDAEKDLEALRVSIRNMEKAIRNEEIKSTN